MNDETQCVQPDQLEAALLGLVTDAELIVFAEHLAECSLCLERVRKMSLTDPMITAVQRQRHLQAEPELEELAQRIIQNMSTQFAGQNQPTKLIPASAPQSPHDQWSELIAELAPPVEADELGRLGGFRILNVLGRGGMGIVFLAEDIRLGRQVALKMLQPSASKLPGAVERFLRESRSAALVNHEHVVTIFQVGEDRGIPFLAQELLVGETLADRLKRVGQLPVSDCLRIVRQIALGLSAAHAKGLLHRDIKPANIWLEEPNSHVKILDFGLARFQTGGIELTETGVALGTPAYMAPEQIAADTALDHRCDLFSLGATFYQMATGRLPFSGKDAFSIVHALAVQVPASPSQVNPAIPAGISDLIDQLLSKNREKRPTSAVELAGRLSELDRGLRAARKSRASSAPVDSVVAMPMMASGNGKPPFIGRKVALAGAGGFLIFFFGILIVITRKDGTKKTIQLPDGDGKTTISITHDADEQVTVTTKNVAGPSTIPSATANSPSESKGTPRISAVDFAAERRAAEWLLSLNAEQIVLVNEQGQRVLPDHGQLPKTNFFVVEANCDSNSNLTDDGLRNLAGCRKIRTLNLDCDVAVTARGLEAIGSAPSLIELRVSITNVGDGISSVLGQFPLLESLSVGSDALRAQLTDEGVAAFPSMRNLKRLRLGGTLVTDRGLQDIVRLCPNLEAIDMSNTPATLAPLRAMRQLRDLWCSGDQLTDSGLTTFREMPKIEFLHLHGPVREGDIQRLMQTGHHLSAIHVFSPNDYSSHPSQADYAALTLVPGLRNVSLLGKNMRLTDATLQLVSVMPNLQSFDFHNDSKEINYTPEAIAKFREQRPDVHLRINNQDYPPNKP